MLAPRLSLWVAMLPLTLLCLAATAADVPTIEVACANPPTGPVVTVWDPYKLTITAGPVQFNYNVPPKTPNSGGAVFVNFQNDGICTFNISTGRKITKWTQFGLAEDPQIVELPNKTIQAINHCKPYCRDINKRILNGTFVIYFERLEGDLPVEPCKAKVLHSFEGCVYEVPDSPAWFTDRFPNTAPGLRGVATAFCQPTGVWKWAEEKCSPIYTSPPPQPPQPPQPPPSLGSATGCMKGPGGSMLPRYETWRNSCERRVSVTFKQVCIDGVITRTTRYVGSGEDTVLDILMNPQCLPLQGGSFQYGIEREVYY